MTKLDKRPLKHVPLRNIQDLNYNITWMALYKPDTPT